MTLNPPAGEIVDARAVSDPAKGIVGVTRKAVLRAGNLY